MQPGLLHTHLVDAVQADVPRRRARHDADRRDEGLVAQRRRFLAARYWVRVHARLQRPADRADLGARHARGGAR